MAIGGLVILLGILPAVALSALILRGLRGLFGVALYRYSLDGEQVGEFSAGELELAVRRRR